MPNRRLSTALAFLLLALVVACARPAQKGPQPPNAVAPTASPAATTGAEALHGVWNIRAVGGNAIPDGYSMTLEFQPGGQARWVATQPDGTTQQDEALWKLEGGELVFTSANGAVEHVGYEVTGTTLRLTNKATNEVIEAAR